MAIKSDAQRKAVSKYNSAHYEQIQIRVEIGEKEKIKAFADEKGLSLNEFIKQSIFKEMNEEIK